MNRWKKIDSGFGYYESESQGSCEVRFNFDKEIWVFMNRLRINCPSLEDALTKLPVWLSEDAFPLDLAEESIWLSLDQCRLYFCKGFFNWLEAAAIWRDIEQFAALNLMEGMRMINQFNLVINIWIRKPVECSIASKL